MSFSRARLGVVLLAAFVPAACSSLNPFDSDSKPFVVNMEPADKLYNDGLAELNKRNYSEAVKKFQEVDRQHPYSDFSRKALIMSTFVSHERGDYPEAITQAKRFLQLHPAHKDAAYAQYLLASSYYNQIPDITRDQAQTEKALQAFEELVQRYPSSEYVADAKQKMLAARDQLAGKEMAVGRFYLKQRNYIGAINRFRAVITQYQTTRHVEEALLRVAEAYYAMGVQAEAQTAAAVLGHNFPDSVWYKDAYALLDKGGLQPREDQGSWISRAFRRVL